MARDREGEVKIFKKSREFSRNENLAGLCLVDHIDDAAKEDRLSGG